MLDMRLFTNPRFPAASVAIALLFFALFGTLFVVTQYLQDVLGFTALQTGLREAPVALALMAAAPLTPVLVARAGNEDRRCRRLAVIAASLLLITRIGPESSSLRTRQRWSSSPSSGSDSGLGLALAPATESIMGSVPPERAGVGSATNDTTREVGGALGVAVLGSVFEFRLPDPCAGLGGHPAPTARGAGRHGAVGRRGEVRCRHPRQPTGIRSCPGSGRSVRACDGRRGRHRCLGSPGRLGGGPGSAAGPPAPAGQALNELALADSGSAVPRASIAHRVLRVLTYGAHAEYHVQRHRLATHHRCHQRPGHVGPSPSSPRRRAGGDPSARRDAMSRSLVWDIATLLLDRAVATVQSGAHGARPRSAVRRRSAGARSRQRHTVPAQSATERNRVEVDPGHCQW